MRPRKNILIYGASDQSIRPVAFALGLREYNVFMAVTLEECKSTLDTAPIVVLIVIKGAQEIAVREVCEWAREHHGDTRTMIVIRANRYLWNFVADRILCQPQEDMALLKESLRTLAARKRGPRKTAADVGSEEQTA